MTYARARLWLGITGVGSLVTIAAISAAMGIPQTLSSTNETFGFAEILQLTAIIGLFMLWLLPLDFLGGYLLPAKYHKSHQSFGSWLGRYVFAAVIQAFLFVVSGSFIIFLSQQYGFAGGLVAISLGIFACVAGRNRLVLSRESGNFSKEKLVDAISLIQSWEIFVPNIVVVEHSDVGFTGGVIGPGKNAKIIIPKAWLEFTREQLATAIARRAVAINSGSYTRGLLLAFLWNVGGFALCTTIPGASFSSVAGLVTTACGFTIWSFTGLLTLPTISRNACLIIDEKLVNQGMPAELVQAAANTMDQMQDGEPDRPRLVEMIFHPVPNVTSRNGKPANRWEAWNVARTTLFFSWACLGFLSRSVHCNVGRPELWTMLPTD